METKKSLRFLARVAVIIVVACVLALAIRLLAPPGGEPTPADKVAAMRAEREAGARAEWAANNATLLPAIRKALDTRDWVFAERTIERFTSIVADERLEALRTEFLRKKRKAEEQILLVEAENLPGNDVVRNHAVYARLASLAPDNDEYARRLRIYSKRLAELQAGAVEKYFKNTSRTAGDHAEARARIDEALALSPAEPRYKALARKLDRDELLFPKGDGSIEVAVEDEGVKDGVRTLYLWVFNVGQETVRLSPDRILLATASNATLRPSEGATFAVSLQPERSVRGRVAFSSVAEPLSVSVEYESGLVTRRFPRP